MAHAYTPGLKVSRRTRYRCRRTLPLEGDVLVAVGQRVGARDVVAQTFLPGDVTPINVANMLALPPGDVPECMLKAEGDRVEIGESIARSKGIFGLFKAECKSRVAGTIESISHVTGQVIVRGESIPIEVRAYLTGEVTEVIERQGVVLQADVALVQGIFGIGGEAFGPIRMAAASHDQDLTPDLISPDMSGSIIVGGARVTARAVEKAIEIGAAAVVSGGIDDSDLRDLLGYDLGVAVTGTERIGTTLIVTEGFGDITMAERTFSLLKSREGNEAAASGATQIRAGVIRPEIVIPLSEVEKAAEPESSSTPGHLEPGTSVRIIRDPYFGRIGTVSALPLEPQVLGSGSKARVLEVSLDDAEKVIIPRANVELIEG